MTLYLRAGPGERAARRPGPHRGQQHPQGRLPGAKRHGAGGHRRVCPRGSEPDDRAVLRSRHDRRVRHLGPARADLGRGERVLPPRLSRRERLAAADRPGAGGRAARRDRGARGAALRHAAGRAARQPGRVGAAGQLRRRRGGRAGLGSGAQVPPPAGVRHHRARRPRRYQPAHSFRARDAVMTRPCPPDAGTSVVIADGTSVGVLSQVIAYAFADLAVSRWLIPDPAARRRIFPGYFRLSVEHALAAGVVCTTPGQDAVALWLPAGEQPAPPPEGYDERLAAITGPWIDRFRTFDQALEVRHPAGLAHHHLAMFAVRPDRQGHGTGSALFRAHHAALDRDGTPAYLEASDLRTRRLYRAHGYADCGAPLTFPGAVMYPMARQPRPGQPSGQALPGGLAGSAGPGPASGDAR